MPTPHTIDTEQTRFSAAWESAQNAMGAILAAYYYGTRPDYVAAVSVAAYAVADLEQHTSPNHKEPQS
ncbi:MAG TPA: hypothetical protein PKE12_09780 [Kiritimatiellia bacterium]|nr:hypothetical protein [Kiritimatiellia bacterium]